MTISEISNVIQNAMVVALKLAAPVLVCCIVIGLIVSILQAATQIHEQSLAAVPKLIAVALVLVFLGPWMLETLCDFARYIFDIIASLS